MPSSVEIEIKVLEKSYNVVIVFFAILLLSLLSKDLTRLNFFTQGCFVPSLVEIGPLVLEKMMNVLQ